MLSEHQVLKDTIHDPNLLLDVLKYKKAFYNSSYANYDDCLKGNFKLIPADNILKELENDFNHMLSSGMFYGKQPNFIETIALVDKLEKNLNEIISNVWKKLKE